jgi:putative transposase
MPPIIAPTPSYEVQIEELRGVIQTERDSRVVKKALAVKLVYQGYSYAAVTSIVEVSMGAITLWKQTYEAEGVEGLRPKHKGRKAYLSASQKEEVLGWLQQKPIWELSEVEHHLAEKYDVAYESKQSYYDLMNEAGLSWKKTSAVNPKKNPEEVAAKKSKLSAGWRSTGRRSSEKSL